MHFNVELKVKLTAEYWFIYRTINGWGLTRRMRNATDFDTFAEAKAAVLELVKMDRSAFRKFIHKEDDFDTPVSLTVLSHMTEGAEKQSFQKLYTFNDQE
ncbi:hypothetical protein ST201phi2-1p409 [Pseudomonas phage 201phi2-1]|uniref:Uncharacterized protein n=1 Tax=Pseudomonas phage 201phi2-1 TaxID=198110 RepID=B3FJR8_BP201|nr:hypothetical protein ST201phi2-1p409 [Pseudomonas phage 201phi2-1]ABY63233.1 hypothetical protein 201phi2-1p409 [Pseudomonas phage 201phi2-1]